jgi:hypothetical protein
MEFDEGRLLSGSVRWRRRRRRVQTPESDEGTCKFLSASFDGGGDSDASMESDEDT